MPSDDDYFDVYDDFTDGENESQFDAFMAVYQQAGLPDNTDTFFQFLNAFYPDTDPYSEKHDKAWWNNIRQSFYNLTGATDRNMNWAAWREIMDAITPRF